jgi:hypothetical protein
MASTAYSELRQQAPRLALALLFQTESQKQSLSALLLFGLELDRIVAQASEPMLALIRLKWWEDQLDQPADDAGPLAGYLHHHIKQGPLSQDKVRALTGLWAASVQSGDTDLSENWAFLMAVMAEDAELQPSDIPGQIGRAVARSRAGKTVESLSARDILRACGPGCEFLICLSYLAREAGRRDLNRAPLLIFALLYQVLFKPASR